MLTQGRGKRAGTGESSVLIGQNLSFQIQIPLSNQHRDNVFVASSAPNRAQ